MLLTHEAFYRAEAQWVQREINQGALWKMESERE
jgi:hypothetical protein